MTSSPCIHLAASARLCLCIMLLLCSARQGALAQQSYAGSVTNCSATTVAASNTSVNVGYTCSHALPTCQTYAYYRTQPSQSISDIASLFGTNTSALTAANSLSNTSSLSLNQPLFIPLSCSCNTLNYSLMPIPYTIHSDDTLYKIASATYQGLTTCGGIQTSNPLVSADGLSIGSSLTVPLRCACPSQTQINQGITLLITYPIVLTDTLQVIGSAFGADISSLQTANSLLQNPNIYPQTTILIPLAQKPEKAPVFGESAQSPTPWPTPSTGKKSSRVGMYVGIATGACLAALLALLAVVYFKRRRSSHDARLSEVALMQESETTSLSFFKNHEIDINQINQKLPSYSTDDIIAATQGFDECNHIKGSVYCGMLGDQKVAIKRIQRNISKEISLFKSLHHSNLVQLLGVCIGSQESFLVYPFIGEGSLKDWLHEFPHKEATSVSPCLPWTARVCIGVDIANALTYLHDYTKPGFLHKNITSSNILVDVNFRGKLSNLGLAKSTEDMGQGMAWTRHIEGTQGYLAPEYINDGQLSSKTDVFAFGIVLLEMLSGEHPIIRTDEGLQLGFLWESISTVLQGGDSFAQENLRNWMDPRLKGHYPLHCAMKMFLLARRCVAKDLLLRPSMSYTATILTEIMEASQKWENEGAHEGVVGR